MTQTAVNFAKALYTLAAEENMEGEVLQQLTVMQKAFAQEPNFVVLLAAPNLSKQEKCIILDNCFRDKVHIYVLNFIKLLTEKGGIRHFDDCSKAFREIYNEENGILPVTAVTAVVLSEDQIKRLTDKLTQITGKTVELQNKVDPAVLGGVRLDYDGKRVDGTVQNRLDSVRELLKNTVL